MPNLLFAKVVVIAIMVSGLIFVVFKNANLLNNVKRDAGEGLTNKMLRRTLIFAFIILGMLVGFGRYGLKHGAANLNPYFFFLLPAIPLALILFARINKMGDDEVGKCQKCGKSANLHYFMGGEFSGGYYCPECYNDSSSKQKRAIMLLIISLVIFVAAFGIILLCVPNFLDTLINTLK